MKKTITFAITFAMLANIPVYAQIPQAYWQYQQPFQNAVASNNKQEILKTSNAIINIFNNLPMDNDKAGILFVTYEALYPIYESMGQYDKAIECLKEYVKYGQYLNFTDAVKIGTKRIEKIDPNVEVYALTKDTSKTPYYGMKNEPKSGTYWGRVHSEISDEPMNEESAVSFYVECLQENVADYDYMIRPYDDGKRIIHIALNMPNENSTLNSVLQSSSDAYIKSTMEYLSTLKSPVLLRIGGEMNVWTNLADPQTFKSAYIKIANVARNIAPNVALVFSPNDVSNWNTEIQNYYPEDNYVDWVGVSLYTNKYQSANSPKANEDFSEMFYGNGAYSNPIAKLREIVTLYGNKKPIIITEGGSGHTIKGGENLTDFAKNRINILYTYVNMVYPQVKGIIYFDQDMNNSLYDYALNHNATVKQQYITSGKSNKAFISNQQLNYAYVKAEQYKDNLSEINLYTYCILPGSIIAWTNYYLDGNLIASPRTIPFPCTISSSSLNVGIHDLKVEIKGENGFLKVKEYTIEKGADGMISIHVK